MFSLLSLRGNNSNQKKIKDRGWQFLVHFGSKRTFEITFLKFCLLVAVLVEYPSGCSAKSPSVHPCFTGKRPAACQGPPVAPGTCGPLPPGQDPVLRRTAGQGAVPSAVLGFLGNSLAVAEEFKLPYTEVCVVAFDPILLFKA